MSVHHFSYSYVSEIVWSWNMVMSCTYIYRPTEVENFLNHCASWKTVVLLFICLVCISCSFAWRRPGLLRQVRHYWLYGQNLENNLRLIKGEQWLYIIIDDAILLCHYSQEFHHALEQYLGPSNISKIILQTFPCWVCCLCYYKKITRMYYGRTEHRYELIKNLVQMRVYAFPLAKI